MTYNYPVDFETFYFIQLLEVIKERGKDKFKGNTQANLNKFIDYMFLEDSPLENIEKLARIQGTSDVSIFFSDLLERMNDYSPEDALNKITEYAGDFLEMYNVLAQDPLWEKNVTQELLADVPGTDVIFSFSDFIKNEIPERIIKILELNAPESIGDTRTLFNRIGKSDDLSQVTEAYRENTDLITIIESLERLYQRPDDAEEYVRMFSSEVNRLGQQIENVTGNSPALFQAFCAGEPLPVAKEEKTPQSDLEEIIETVRQFEKRPSTPMHLSEEDQNLRWLLKDYIIHEIEELGEEVSLKLDKVLQDPQNSENQAAFLDALKVFKDLGQIHKYPEIEKVSSEILVLFKKLFEGGQRIHAESKGALGRIFKSYVEYINAVLNEDEKDGLLSVNGARQNFLNIIAGKSVEEAMVSFEDKAELEPVFAEVNSRFIASLRDHYHRYLGQNQNIDLLLTMTEQIEHLERWYEILELENASKLGNALLEWFDTSELLENLTKHQDVVHDALDILSSRIYTAQPAEWENALAKFSEFEIAGESYPIEQSLEAFQDVTLRRLRTMEQALKNPEISYETILKDHYVPGFSLISRNSSLLRNNELQMLCNHCLGKIQVLEQIPDQFRTELRDSLSGIVGLIAQAIAGLPAMKPVDTITRKYDKIIRSILDKAGAMAEQETEAKRSAGEVSGGGRDIYVDEELRTVFRTEAKRYLNEINKYLDILTDNLEDRDALRKLGNITHTLKGSAQMLNQTHISELAAPFENAVELILEDNIQLSEDFLPIYQNAILAIGRRLNDMQVDSQEIISPLNEYLKMHFVEDETAKVPAEFSEESSIPDMIEQIIEEETAEESGDQEGGEELPAETAAAGEAMFTLHEKDPELLEIFRGEATDKLDAIEENLTLIEKFTHDKKTLQSLDQSVHEVRAAAKMLGLSEIGALLDDAEHLVEIINKSEMPDWNAFIPILRKVVQVVRELADNAQISRNEYESAADALSNALTEKKMEEEEFEIKESVARGTEKEKTEVLEPSAQVMEAFIQEAREYLDDINFLLMKMEKNPENEELSYHLMRSLHTLKGSSAMVYLDTVERMAHLSEDLVEKLREKHETLPQKVADLLFEVVDEIEFIVDSLAGGMKGKTKNYEEVVQKLRNTYAELFGAPAAAEEEKEEAAGEIPARAEDDKEYLSIADEFEHVKSVPRDTYVRLHVNQMDDLLNEAAELVINHTQFKTQLDKFKNYAPRMDTEGKNLQNILWYLESIINEERRLLEMSRPYMQNLPAVEETQKNQIENIKRALHNLQVFYNNFVQTMQGIKESGKLYDEQVQKITRLSTQIHEEIMQARLVPIAILFQRFNRPLRDLARKHNKQIKLYLEGESTELDRVLIEELYEPMLHILRNAIDHGIESPEERKKAGKPEEGLIKIAATHERNFVTVEIQEDGRGIDIDKVRQRAIDLELLEPEHADELSEQEIFEFLMYPGFSTAETTTRLSGRGVGLDVVKNQIQKIKGDIRIYSEKGKGTRFLIRVPISLTVTQAMLVEVSGYIYAIPLLQVEETAKITIRDLELRDDVYYMRHRGGHMPVLNMNNLLNIHGGKRRPVSVMGEYPVIIVQDEGNKVALLVDKIVHREEILIKSLGPALQRVNFVAGGSVLADGKVVLVLDVPEIVREGFRLKEGGIALNPEDVVQTEPSSSKEKQKTERQPRQKRVIEGRKPFVLIVDDSLSIRKFLAGLLTQQGYEVEMAKNGYNALEKLNQTSFDLLLTDLEMPHLSGYELIEQLRAESRWDNLPIIVLTGRASKHIQQLTKNLGADEFIIKPFKENELLEKISNFVEWKP